MIPSLTARDCMTSSPILLRPESSILEAARLLVESRISGAPVVDQIGNLVGILSERDCLSVVLESGYHQDHGGKVGDFMSPEVQTVDLETPVVEIAERFINERVRRFPVIKNGQVVGVVSRRDVIRMLEQAT